MTKQCKHADCARFVESGSDECFHHRVKSVGFALHGPANVGDFHKTRNDHMREHFGTTDDRELGRRGIERA